MATARADHSGGLLRGKVLIVDDEAGIRELVKLVLAERYQVTEVDSGAALWKALEDEQPDVVLLDVTLPDANGLAMLPAIRQRWPGTQVIVLTGAAYDTETMLAAVDAVSRGVFSLLSKSADFSLQKLLAGVRSAMERRFRAPAGPRAPAA